MTREELKELCLNIKPIKLSVTKNQQELKFKECLLSETKFLDFYNKVPLTLRYYCILNDVVEIPTCLYCDNPVTYKKDYPDKGFAEYCSPTCSRSDKTVPKEILKFLSDRDWLYEQRITLKKSKELIASELKVSTTPINKWLKIHDIPNVKYNESSIDIKIFLEDYVWMYNEYITKRKTLQDIAEDLGVVKSTVGNYMLKHNIPMRDPNEYDRKNEGSSQECLEIIDFIKSFYTKEILIDKRGVIGSLELDIYLPEDNLAIEYNGLYSHYYRPNELSFSAQKGPKYHITKTENCENNNIQLIHILSNQWLENKSLWKSFIKNKLGYTENKVYARNCDIRSVSTYDKNIFLDKNHIQGNAKSTFRYGLYFNDELVSLITFGKPRYNKECKWELIRFCNKQNYNVVGGFSKLLKYFRKNHPGSIVTYANRMYSNGNLYKNNGFSLIKINKPSYWYIDKNCSTIIHKSNLRKNKLLKLLNVPTKTERQLSEELGYNIIWDCGTKTYILE